MVRALKMNSAVHWPAANHPPMPAAIQRTGARSSSVLQRMEGPPEPEMRSQFGAEGLLVDLNCGRYCTESAMKWWAQTLGWNIGGDVFHQLPEPTPKSVFGMFSVKASWSPAVEGSEFTVDIAKPATLGGWRDAITRHGPLIVSGDLGDAIITWVGHYVLIVGVDLHGRQLLCKDPLKGNEIVRRDFDWIQDRIKTVRAVNLKKLRELKL